MPQEPLQKLLDPSLVARWIAQRQFIWQMQFLSAENLCRFASERGLGFSILSDDIQRLWQIGVLRADLLISDEPMEIAGLVYLERNTDGKYLYGDERTCITNSNGLLGIINQMEEIPAGIEMLFHPLRYYVLYHLQRVVEMNINPTVMLRSAKVCREITEYYLKGFEKWSSSESCSENFAYWNDIVSLAVAAEPFTFNRLFGVMTIPYQYTKNQEQFRAILNQHFAEFTPLLTMIGVDRVKEIVAELCRHAEMLEPNDDVRLLVRLTKGRYRLEKVKGRLGGSTYLLTAAEMIRRSAEKVFDVQLAEENDLDSEGLNEYLYGSDRLLDDYKARGEFVRDLRLDHGLRLRWYVEGDTEFGALDSEFAGNEAVELINLRGNFVAKQGKGLSFRENLSNDIRWSVYSWVSLDGDVVNNLKVVKQAAKDDEMFGMFFVSTPDFETANFTLKELQQILWRTALEANCDPAAESTFFAQTSTAQNAKELLNLARKAAPAITELSKGKAWGEKLMEFAREHPKMTSADGTLAMRPIVEAIYHARHALQCNYHMSRKVSRVDENTGKIVDRKASSATT